MNEAELEGWLLARLPAELAASAPQLQAYDDELVIMLTVAGDESAGEGAARARIAELREASRPLRMQLARELQGALRRSVAWGMRLGAAEELFTTRSMPVMTRLNRSERDVLDTLVAAGVADTRSAALAYTVRAFSIAHGEWLTEVRTAIEQVQQVRSKLKLRRRPGEPPSAAGAEPSEG
jgi:hypothetical protein